MNLAAVLPNLIMVILGLACGQKEKAQRPELIYEVASKNIEEDAVAEERSTDKPDSAETPAEINADQSTVAVFATSVHALTSQYCGSCHLQGGQSPFLGDPDVETAYREIMQTSLVDVNAPERSRIHLRLLQDQHNCWTPGPDGCRANAAEMEAALRTFAQSLKGEPALSALIKSTTSTLDQATRTEPNTIVLEAEWGTSSGGAVRQTMDGASSGEAVVFQAGSNSANYPRDVGSKLDLTYIIGDRAEGEYAIWLRGKDLHFPALKVSYNYLRIGDFKGYPRSECADNPQNSACNTEPGSWVWLKASLGGGDDLRTHGPGIYGITLMLQVAGGALDQVIISKEPNFVPDGIETPRGYHTLEFSLSEHGVAATVEVQTTYFSGSFYFLYPKLISGTPILMSGLTALMDDQAAVQSTIWQDIGVDGSPLSSGILSLAPMIVPYAGDPEAAQVSLGFTVLQNP